MSKGDRTPPKLPGFVCRLPGPLRAFIEIVARTVDEFLEDGAPRLAAALAYYLLIALAPLLIVLVTVATTLFEHATVRDALIATAYNAFGEAGASVVNQVLLQVTGPSDTTVTSTAILGAVIALFGASAAFTQLQAALNIVWGVRARPESFTHMLRRRGLAFLTVIIIGIALLGALALSTGFARLLGGWVPTLKGITWLTEKSVSFIGTALLFGILFTILPDYRVDWRDTVVGALVTSALFNVGSVALGSYMGQSSVASFYGAAGSIAVMLVWLYYSTQVLLFGAEFTYVWAARHRQGRSRRGEHDGSVV
ncbi:MAG: YihY/virulence factor BrkB family protein [Coriobacteriia bacterium]|jgi:membrane protein|nr:YihY/virulence factor BrkB family protein [Coriobacteriia bacterium]